MTIIYGLGMASGYRATDTVQIADVNIANFNFLNALNVTQSESALLGVGMAGKEWGVATGTAPETPTFIDSLYTHGIIGRRLFSLYLNDQRAPSGSILFGGIDTAKYMGDLVTMPMNANRSGIYDHYTVTLSSLVFNSGTERMTLSPANMSTNGVLDSGTTAMFLPESIANALVEGFGAIYNEALASYFVPCEYKNSEATLEFTFGGLNGKMIAVPVSSLIGPPSPATIFGDGIPACMFEIAAFTPVEEEALGSIILGDAFMRAAYIVYDIDNHEISLAQARMNTTTGDIVPIHADQDVLPGVTSTASVTATQEPMPTGALPSQVLTFNASATAFPSTPSQPSFTLDVTAVPVKTVSVSTNSVVPGTYTGDATGPPHWSWILLSVSIMAGALVVFDTTY
jgi:hypothetical protein